MLFLLPVPVIFFYCENVIFVPVPVIFFFILQRKSKKKHKLLVLQKKVGNRIFEFYFFFSIEKKIFLKSSVIT
jgi:hypothetical protein